MNPAAGSMRKGWLVSGFLAIRKLLDTGKERA